MKAGHFTAETEWDMATSRSVTTIRGVRGPKVQAGPGENFTALTIAELESRGLEWEAVTFVAKPRRRPGEPRPMCGGVEITVVKSAPPEGKTQPKK